MDRARRRTQEELKRDLSQSWISAPAQRRARKPRDRKREEHEEYGGGALFLTTTRITRDTD